MRRFFVLAMILLTSLRGLVGDAMAFEMMPAHQGAAVQTAHAVAAHDHHHDHACPHTAATSCQEPATGNACATSTGCMACQICHSPALQASLSFAIAPDAAMAHDDPHSASWMSADLMRLKKPPVL